VQKLLTRLFNAIMKSWSWILLILLTILIKWASWYPEWVEHNYTYGLYPLIARVQRVLFGWLPFSLGDLFYGFLVLIVLYKTFNLVRTIWRRQFNRAYLVAGMQQGIFFFLFVYVFFNLLWGLNYNRQGISRQLELEVKPYEVDELDGLMSRLQDSLNNLARTQNLADRKGLQKKKELFSHAEDSYEVLARSYPFLRYQSKSVKPSLFSYLGNYLGFQGYYNPFSGEAQVNTTVPMVVQPFVTTHEIAHQLGYAKENEANFVAFLACEVSPHSFVRYSMYFDMYNYALREMSRRDTSLAGSYYRDLDPLVKKDFEEYRQFYRRHRNPLETAIMWGYGHYLKANNQPAGKDTYNEVVAWLIAYYKKYG
jgi:hypothetical protein